MKQNKPDEPVFNVSQVAEFEEYLQQQFAKGKCYSGRSSFGNKLLFSDCEPVRMTVRLDFIPKGMRRAEYLNRLNGTGVTHLGRFGFWEVLACPDGTLPADLSDLSDQGLFHSLLERAEKGRGSSMSTAILSVLPAIFFGVLAGFMQDTQMTNFCWEMTIIFLIFAFALCWPAYKQWVAFGHLMDQARKEEAGL